MTEFNEGDNAWYFNFPEDGCGGLDVSAVALCVDKNIQGENLKSPHLHYAYKSKSDAIYAMIEHLIKNC